VTPAAPVKHGKVLEESSARALASRLTADALKVDPPKGLEKFGAVKDADWKVTKQEGRWQLQHLPKSGIQAEITFRLDGAEPQVMVSIASSVE